MEEQLTPTPAPLPQKTNHWMWIGVCFLMLALGIGIGVVLGKYWYQKPTAYVTASPTPSPSADPTANWKMYTNTQYGFSIKHPEFDETCCGLAGAVTDNPVHIVTLADKSTVRPNSDAPFDGLAVYIIPNTNGLTLVQYIEKEKNALLDQFKIMGGANATHKPLTWDIEVASQPAISLVDYSWDGITRTYFKHPNSKVIIEISKKEQSLNHFVQYDQILSTFKFLGQGGENIYKGKYFTIDTSTWKLLSDANQSPATPEVLETVLFENGKAHMNVQVGTDSVEKVLSSQDGNVVGKQAIGGVEAIKKSGYGGIAGSVYSVSLVASFNEKTYLISFYTLDVKNINDYEKSFNEVVPIFKFTQ